MQGKLQVLLQGRDKNSVKREEYEAYLKEINMFMDVFTRRVDTDTIVISCYSCYEEISHKKEHLPYPQHRC